MKILHLIDSGGLYGAEQVLLTLMRGLQRKGDDVVLGSLRLPQESEKPVEKEVRSMGMEVWPLPMAGISRNRMLDLRERCNAEGVVIVHSHGYKANILNSMYFAASAPKGVATLHGWTAASFRQRVWWYQLLEKRLLPRLAAVVAVHERMALLDRLPRDLRRRLHIIPNGISLVNAEVDPECLGSVEQALVTFCRRKPTIAIVGRVSREKGVLSAIESFAALRRNRVDAQLAVVGVGPELHACKRLVDHLQVTDHVLFAGFVKHVPALMKEFSALLLPSLQEGMPMTVLEAMRAEVPVIASAVGAVPDLLEHGQCGYLVEAGNVQELSASLQRVFSCDGEAALLARRAGQRFRNSYVEEKTVDAYRTLYCKLLLKTESSREAASI